MNKSRKPFLLRLHEVFTFRHFARKSYALFSVLGREVRVGVLSVATLATAAPCLAQASYRRRRSWGLWEKSASISKTYS